MYKQWGKGNKYKGELIKEKGDFLCEVSAKQVYLVLPISLIPYPTAVTPLGITAVGVSCMIYIKP